jgi:hypothetical protein
MVVGFTTTYSISVYRHWCCEFESWSGRGVQHYVITIVSDLRQVGGFLWVLWFPPPIKLTATIYSWVWPAVLILLCCVMAMGLYECGWLSLGWYLHNGDGPVWIRPYFLRLTCCLMTMNLHECSSHGSLREDRENEMDISRLWPWYQHLQTWTLNKR